MSDIVFLLFGLWVAWKVFKAFSFPEAGFIFIFSFALYVYSGAILMGFDDYYSSAPQYPQLLTMVRGGFLVMVLACLLVSRFSTLTTPDFKGYHTLSRSESNAISILAGACVVACLIYLIIMPGNPVTAMFANSEAVALEREAVTTKMKSFGFFSNIFYFYMPIAWLVLYFQGKQKTAYLVLFINMMTLMATGQKSPLVFSLLYLILAMGLSRGRFNYRAAGMGGLVLAILLIGVVVMQNWHLLSGSNESVIWSAVEGLWRRVFMLGAIVLLDYMQTFPDAHPFLIQQASSLPPDRIVYITTFGEEIAGRVNAVSLGNFYAYFGEIYLAILLMFFLVLAFNGGGWALRKMMGVNPITQALYVVYCVVAVKLVITDWWTVLPAYWLSCFVTLGFVYAFQMGYFFWQSGKSVAYGKYWLVVSSLLALLYFAQGQARFLISL
jgi:hypothetical protein